MSRSTKFTLLFLLAIAASAHAIELRMSSQALERTLKQQLFSGPDGRYYIRGDAKSACYVYVEDPKVTFVQDRIVVHVRTKSRLGAGFRSTCIGVGLSTEADVSLLPEAEGESIGFRDARIDNLSTPKEISFLLIPFLSHKLPQQMKINAAEMLRSVLTKSAETTGYTMTLDRMKIHSMMIEASTLVVDVDGAVSIK